MFSCLQINCQPFYLRQLLKFHPFDWMIEIYLQTEGQGTHHKMVLLQPMPGFPPLLFGTIFLSQGSGFCTFVVPGVGQFALSKNSRGGGGLPGGWSSLELTDTLFC